MLLVKACYEITFKNVLNICSYIVLAISIKIVLFYLQQEDEGSDTAGQAGDAAEREGDSDSNSDEANSDESGDEKPLEKAVSTVDEEEEEAEWERFQKRINK